MLVLGVTILFIVFSYAFIWEPLKNENTQLMQRLEASRNDLAWMTSIAPQIKALSNKPTKKKVQQGSLLTTIDQTARNFKIDNKLERAEPQSNGQIRVTYKEISFIKLSDWLKDLAQKDIEVLNMSLNRQREGIVDASLVLGI